MNLFKVYNKDAECVDTFSQRSKVTQEQRYELNSNGFFLRDQLSRSGKKVVRSVTPIKLSGE